MSRVSIVSNTVGMFVAVAPYWDATEDWFNFFGHSLFHIWIVVGLVFGIIAFLSYVSDAGQGSAFYWTTWIFYNSALAGLSQVRKVRLYFVRSLRPARITSSMSE